MPATNPPIEWTAELARALPEDGKRYEVLDGELFVTPAPNARHQGVLAALFVALHPYVQAHRIGALLWSPADIEFSPRRLVQPDLFVAPLGTHGRIDSWRDVRSLVLAIEALSPSTAFADRTRKRAIYQDEGVGEYWIVDLDARLIERWRQADARPEIALERLVWQPPGASDALTIDVQALFESVLGPAE